MGLLTLFSLTAAAAEAPGRPDREGFIRDWLLLGPFYYDPLWPAGELEVDRQQVAGEAALQPGAGERADVRASADAPTLTWTAVASQESRLDLAKATGVADEKQAQFKLAYAVAYVVAERPMEAVRLRVGTNDMAKVYWNGRPVIRHVQTVGGGDAQKDKHAAIVDVKKGVNVLVVKVINDEKSWSLYARFVAGGRPLTELRVSWNRGGRGPLAAPDQDGFLRDWLVLGAIRYAPRPYAEGALAKSFVPREGDLTPRPGELTWVDGQPLKWAPYRAKDYFIDFTGHARANRKLVPPFRWEPNDSIFNPAAYAVAYVVAPSELKDLTVAIGANDHGKLWVNGKEAASRDLPGALKRDVASGKVTLKKGSNVLLFKVINAGDNWQACVRFLDRAGRPVTDLALGTSPPPTPEELAARD